MNVLETKVSFFTHFKDTTSPTEGTFLQIVNSAKLASKYAPLIERIRATADKEERTRLKAQLPCFTPSGTFGRRASDGLISHSGLMQFDIDPKENPLLTPQTAAHYRTQISNLPQVAYCALSASGAGVWGVVPIAHPDQHRAHFEALKSDFAGWGIAIDTACSNVDRLRFWSYDPEAFLNPEATLYTKLYSTKAEAYKPRQRPTIATDNAAKVEAVLQQIEATRTDITSGGNGYEDWFAIGCAFANEFGENGRDYFHRASQYYPKYSSQETEGQFSNCLRKSGNGYTLGTFFEVARRYGVEYKKRLIPQSQRATYSAPSVLPHGYKHERFTDSGTGQVIEVLLNAEGYPAKWDLAPTQKEILTNMIKSKPEITELITRFDLQLLELQAKAVAC